MIFPRIERRFLVTAAWQQDLDSSMTLDITWGFMNVDIDASTAVRISSWKDWLHDADICFFDGKDPHNHRYEFAVTDIENARKMIGRTAKHNLLLRRHVAKSHGQTWYVDEYLGHNRGLILASPTTSVNGNLKLPSWCGFEVTDLARFGPVELAQKEFALEENHCQVTTK
jgi:CYTH domain-containing protein